MQNGEQPIRLPNGFLYPRVEEDQRTHSGDEIDGLMTKNVKEKTASRPNGLLYPRVEEDQRTHLKTKLHLCKNR